MPRRKCSQKKVKVTKPCKCITLPTEWDEYQNIVNDKVAFRQYVDSMIAQYPELFPASIEQGYKLHDKRSSKKMPEVSLRRVKLKTPDERGKDVVVTIAPSAVMPYMTGYTDEVEKPLFLRRFGVPFWALAYVFGRDEQYWYRLASHFGSYDIVQTTVRDPNKLPDHLLADEKHIRLNGEKAYIATTVGGDCVLGASIALKADTDQLTEAYRHFQTEAQQRKPDYAPQTVNTDGWIPTQKAWLALFPLIIIIECFLHAFLKIRDRCKGKFKRIYPEIKQRVWDIYSASDREQFQQQIAAFKQWGQDAVSDTALEAIDKLCAKVDRFILTFDHPDAYRTSNMIDRHMEPMARWLFSSRFFHGHWASAEKQVRAWALFHNYWPYCPRAKVRQTHQSPAHRLNERVYHDNWLHNLLVSTSLVGANC
jgi:hypothetical protein